MTSGTQVHAGLPEPKGTGFTEIQDTNGWDGGGRHPARRHPRTADRLTSDIRKGGL